MLTLKWRVDTKQLHGPTTANSMANKFELPVCRQDTVETTGFPCDTAQIAHHNTDQNIITEKDRERQSQRREQSPNKQAALLSPCNPER